MAEEPRGLEQDVDGDSNYCLETNDIKPRPPHLLTLPPEIRHQIWKAATHEDPILLCSTSFQPIGGGSFRITSLTLAPIHPNYPNYSCSDRHVPTRSSAQPSRPSPIPPHRRAWLRTSRQVLAEARRFRGVNPSLLACNPLLLRAYLDHPPPIGPTAGTLRSLALCVKVHIARDPAGGYSFMHCLENGWEPERSHDRAQCGCPLCLAIDGMPEDLGACFPALREIRLRLDFGCAGGQGVARRVPSVLEGRGSEKEGWEMETLGCVDGWERVGGFAEEMCGVMPLRRFVGKELDVEVRFGRGIAHGSRWGECWCVGCEVDDEDAVRGRLGDAIRGRLWSRGCEL